MKTTFIYALYEPVSLRIRYVGKSDSPKTRLGTHISGSSKHRSHLGHWLKLLASRGEKPVLEILDEVPVSQWEFWEREYIRVFRALGMDLVNTTDGGDAPPILYGENHPLFGKEGLVGVKNPMFGKPRTEEVKAKLRSHCGANSKITGMKRSESTCEKHRIVATGVPCSEEKKQKISRSLLGTRHSEATRKLMSQSRLGKKRSETAKENMRAAQQVRRALEKDL